MIKADVVLKDIEGLDATIDEIIDAIDANLEDVAEFIFQEAKASLVFKDKTGNLRRSIKLKKSKFPDGGYIVSARGKNKGRGAGYHAHLVEFGHLIVVNGRQTGERVPPHPFMRQSVEKGYIYAVQKFRGNK